MILVRGFLLLLTICAPWSTVATRSAGVPARTFTHRTISQSTVATRSAGVPARTFTHRTISQSTATALPLLTQKISRRASQRFGYGGTVTIIGAPQGSIVVEGWQRNEVEVTAEIELQAATEEDLRRLATVNGFVFDEDLNHVRILTTGTHDRTFMRRAVKNFPKKLLGLPWKIDYRIRVPLASDIEIDAGRGPIKVAGVEGALRLSATESETELVLTGGTVNTVVAVGTVNVRIPVRSWRGAGAEIRLARGALTVEVPTGFNGDIDVEILRVGKIEDGTGGLEKRERPGITERQVKARSGAGGAYFHFVVGDGTVTFKKLSSD